MMTKSQAKQIEDIARGEALDVTKLIADNDATKAMNGVVEAQAADPRATFAPPPKLPDSFIHIEGVSDAGRLSSTAAAQQLLSAANAIEEAGKEYERAGEDAARVGRELAQEYAEVAEKYRERAAGLFEQIQTAAIRSQRARELAQTLIDNLDR
jgi:hypothetical protein